MNKNNISNVFVSFLYLLKVKHTKSFSSKYFNEHPHKYNLFGLSKMLSDYGIENAAIRINDKENGLLELEAPFIAHTGTDFVNVYQLTPEKINYIWRGKEISVPIEEFQNTWSGIALFAEPDEHSIEPGYKENREKEHVNQWQQYLLLSTVCLVVVLGYISNNFFNNSGMTLSLLINLIGIYTGYLLVLKQMRIQSNYADKICSLFKQSDCNNVLESSAAKLMGVIGWSEVGLGYFISNTLVILFLPHLMSYLAIINTFTLPYTAWSIWYQKVKAQQWCPLCLIIQALLWGGFTINLIFGYIQLPSINIVNILSIGCIYTIPLLIINTLIPKLSMGNKVEQIIQEINSLKVSEEVFFAQLKKQPHCEVDKSTSQILLGNPNSQTLITILTNPHCEPCGRMHTRVEKLLEDTKGSLCVQYIFSSFDEELESSSDFLIRSYLKNDKNQAKIIFHDWFQKGKHNKEEFFKKYHFEPNSNCEEHLAHIQWKERSQLNATPTILVNGYILPDNYKIEDLKYFT